MTSLYEKAQAGMSLLKAEVHDLLRYASQTGLRNVNIGKGRGIYAGYVGHEGCIPRTLLVNSTRNITNTNVLAESCISFRSKHPNLSNINYMVYYLLVDREYLKQ